MCSVHRKAPHGLSAGVIAAPTPLESLPSVYLAIILTFATAGPSRHNRRHAKLGMMPVAPGGPLRAAASCRASPGPRMSRSALSASACHPNLYRGRFAMPDDANRDAMGATTTGMTALISPLPAAASRSDAVPERLRVAVPAY